MRSIIKRPKVRHDICGHAPVRKRTCRGSETLAALSKLYHLALSDSIAHGHRDVDRQQYHDREAVLEAQWKPRIPPSYHQDFLP